MFVVLRTSHDQLSSGRVHSSAVERATLHLTAVVRHDVVNDQLTDDAQLRTILPVVFQQSRLHVLHLDLVLVAVEQLARVLEPAPRRQREVSDMTPLRPVFSASRVQHVSDLHLKFALRPHHVWKYGRHPLCDR